jgi:hypothetical protein
MTPGFKLFFIACCLAIALASFFRCSSKKDWGWLVGGLFFTLLADYFLVLKNEHLLGVAAFCFVHVCYILRVVKLEKRLILPLVGFLMIWTFSVFAGVIFVSAVYALLFALNMYVNLRARRPKLNYILVIFGLVLFALCDFNVMLFNLPHYFRVQNNYEYALSLIWIFYLPSQILLAISAVKYTKARQSTPHTEPLPQE